MIIRLAMSFKQFRWILLLFAALLLAQPARADEGEGSVPDVPSHPMAHVTERVIRQDEPCQAFLWRAMDWETLKPVCSFYLYNQGQPTASEVKAYCGPSISGQWFQTSQISPSGEAPDHGIYMLLDKIVNSTCSMASHLAPVKFTHTISSNKLIITASEPLPEHSIQSIQGYYGSHPFECAGNRCEIQAVPTDNRGERVWYQAISSYDEQPTPRQHLYIRSQDGVIQVIDADHGTAAQQAWGSFPDGDPGWLDPAAAESSQGLAYLAGRLIETGQVDASSSCPGGGLLFNGYANLCGLEAARPVVDEAQNQYNARITAAAAAQGIPGQLLKSLIMAESQFWDGPNPWVKDEAGIGHLTHNGADTLLMWHDEAYQQHCLPLFGSECNFGYTRLDDWQQGAIQNSVMEDPDIETVAQALLANARQAGAVITDELGGYPGQHFSHEDIWRMALVNYNAGPGCLGAAIREAERHQDSVTIEGIMFELDLLCPGAAEYPNQITNADH